MTGFSALQHMQRETNICTCNREYIEAIILLYIIIGTCHECKAIYYPFLQKIKKCAHLNGTLVETIDCIKYLKYEKSLIFLGLNIFSLLLPRL